MDQSVPFSVKHGGSAPKTPGTPPTTAIYRLVANAHTETHHPSSGGLRALRPAWCP
jgi:hypothetical protein